MQSVPGYPAQAATGYPAQTTPAAPGYALAPATPPAPAAPAYPAPSAPAYGTPGYAGPVYPAPVYPARPSSGVAIAAMICGIVGFVFSWATLFILIPVLVSIAAVILGHVALGQLKKNPNLGGRGMAITGLVLGYIPIAITLILLVIAIIALVAFGAFTLPFVFSS